MPIAGAKTAQHLAVAEPGDRFPADEASAAGIFRVFVVSQPSHELAQDFGITS